MNDIIERLEKATGPDRVLDFDISEAVGACYPYTASIDAAMTLVPEGCGWDVTFDGDATVYIIPKRSDMADFRQFHSEGAATPALALCIAALKARASSIVLTGDGRLVRCE